MTCCLLSKVRDSVDAYIIALIFFSLQGPKPSINPQYQDYPLDLKNLLWKVARATIETNFNKCLQDMKAINTDCID